MRNESVTARVASGPRIAAAFPTETAREWRSLRYFNFYRVIVAGLMVTLGLSGVAPRFGPAIIPTLFNGLSLAYVLFGIGCSFTIRWRRPRLETQVLAQVFTDIVLLTLLLHASGGVTSGLGMLLVITVAAGSILARRRIAILFAALAAVAVLTEQMVAGNVDPVAMVNYTHAGVLGTAFFAAALLANVSASRIRATEALVAEREVDLRNLAQLNEYIIHRMQSGILVVDTNECIVLSNESSRALLGIDRQVDGHPLTAVAPALHACLARWRRDVRRASFNFRSFSAGLELTASFAGLGPNGSSGALVFLEDSSAMTQRAQQLKLASLGRLTASIAHEIRNPLGAISHAGQLLGESHALEGGDIRLSQIIQDNCRRMNGVIENVLELSRRRPAIRHNLGLGAWLEGFVAEHAASGERPGDAIVWSMVPDESVTAPFDPDQLHQVVSNLVENALRHSSVAEAGTPEAGVSEARGPGASGPPVALRAGTSRETQRPYLDIIDSGEGIAEVDRDNVFEPFFTTRGGGTGLGLYIARELCEANQATMRLLPAERGCRFRITFADPRRGSALMSEQTVLPLEAGAAD